MTLLPNPHEWQLLQPGSRIFFVGIGGISMSGLAEIAMAAGHKIGGSDKNPTYRTEYLANQGMTIFKGHRSDWIDQFQPDLVIHTAAVHEDNPELVRARALLIRTIDRATFLGWLNRSFDQVINIAGTHGKTTTTAICSLILTQAGMDPTVHLGAELEQFHGTVRLGQPGKLMVSEACEYMNSFHRFFSTTAAILNIDFDHVDCFPDLKDVIHAFTLFANALPDGAYLIVPDFDDNVRLMLDELADMRRAENRAMPHVVFFGEEKPAADRLAIEDRPAVADKPAIADRQTISDRQPDFCCRNLVFQNGMPSFDVWFQDQFYARIHLNIPGRHNMHDALAAIACAHFNGASPEAAETVLNSFHGAEGRFTDVGTYRGARVIADYAHHPAAARATLAAAANIPHRHTWVVFQPLTFSRTKVLFQDFVDALKDCELVIFSEIYSDREVNPGDISSRDIANRIRDLGGRAIFAEDFQQIRDKLDEIVEPEDLILVLGPENIREFADHLTGRHNMLEV